MPTDARLIRALQPFGRRSGVVEFWKHSMPALAVAVITLQILWIAGIRNPFVAVALLAAAVGISAVAALRRKPALIDVARRVDQRAGLQDLVVSAVDSRGDGLAALVRDEAVNALARQNPRDLYPLELPAAWRRIAVAALAAETVLVALAWQAPAERASNPSLASMVLPASSAAASKTAQPTPQNRTDARPVEPSSSSSPAVSATPGNRTMSAIDPGGTRDSAAISGGTDRIRLAAANAENDIAAGRVPAARRAIVERYFAALQAQRKTPR